VKNIVYVVNNQAIGYDSLSRIIDYPLDLIAKKFVTKWVTGSNSARIRLCSVLKIENVLTIHNGIIPRPPTMSRLDVFHKLQINDEYNIVVGCVGLLEKRKGHIVLLEAIKLLSDKWNNVLFVIEGTGSEYNSLKNFIEGNNIKNVMIVSVDFDIYNLYAIFDFLVLPSIEQEDFPNVILEAMSIGLPVIGSDVAGIPEQISDGVTGFVFEKMSYTLLSEKIAILLDDKELRLKMGQAAKEKFNSNFTAIIADEKYKNLYCSLVNEKGDSLD
jgi:glycosyltransferase involved in cell wall biosynthesis